MNVNPTVCCDLALVGFSVAFLVIVIAAPELAVTLAWPYTGAVALRLASRAINVFLWRGAP